jgi:hypothetical protein
MPGSPERGDTSRTSRPTDKSTTLDVVQQEQHIHGIEASSSDRRGSLDESRGRQTC